MKWPLVFAFLLVLAGCTSAADNGDANNDPANLADEILGGVQQELDPAAVEPAVDPPAFRPGWVPDGFEVSRASAASPDFMSIEIAGPDTETASLIWGDELVDFEILAQSDPEGAPATVRSTDATVFTFGSTEESVGPAIIWREPSGIPVVVIGSSELTTDDITKIADGITEITQQEFIDLALELAEARLAEIEAEADG